MSTIRILTASTGKAGEKTLKTGELGEALTNVKSGWLDILNPGEVENIITVPKTELLIKDNSVTHSFYFSDAYLCSLKKHLEFHRNTI